MRVRRWLPEVVIALGAIYCGAVAAYGVMTVVLTSAVSGWSSIALGAPLVGAVVLASALLLPRGARAKLALALASFCVAILAAELYLTVPDDLYPTARRSRMEQAAREAGRPIDARTVVQVLRDQRSQGVDAVPILGSSSGVTIAGQDGRALPTLAGVSLATTVYCNESGQRVIYMADEHGFNNPRGLHWHVPLQVALLGDSFTHGACVPREASLAGLVREAFPHTLNLGIGGAGPLSTFARFLEYAAPLRPRFIVWNWFEGNDLADLLDEVASPPLRRYLTAEASFGLKTRQAEIDRALRHAIDARMQDPRRGVTAEPTTRGVLLLRSIRQRLRPVTAALTLRTRRNARRNSSFSHEELGVVERILTTVRNTAQGWGGEIVVVYLPDPARYCSVASGPSWRTYCAADRAQRRRQHRLGYRDDMLAMFARLGLPVVDGHSAFVDGGRPVDMFYFPGSHYSPEGYRVIADALLRELKSRLSAAEAASPAPLVTPGAVGVDPDDVQCLDANGDCRKTGHERWSAAGCLKS